jgi:hypothetical protein
LHWFETLEEAKAIIEDWPTTRVDLATLNKLALAEFARRWTFQAPSWFNQRRKLTLGMVLETKWIKRIHFQGHGQMAYERGIELGFSLLRKPRCRFSIGCSSEIGENEGSQSHSITPGDPG